MEHQKEPVKVSPVGGWDVQLRTGLGPTTEHLQPSPCCLQTGTEWEEKLSRRQTLNCTGFLLVRLSGEQNPEAQPQETLCFALPFSLCSWPRHTQSFHSRDLTQETLHCSQRVHRPPVPIGSGGCIEAWLASRGQHCSACWTDTFTSLAEIRLCTALCTPLTRLSPVCLV